MKHNSPWMTSRLLRLTLLVIGLIGAPQLQAGILYDVAASADLSITNMRLFDFGSGEFFAIERPSGDVLDIAPFIATNSGAAGTFPGNPGHADAAFSGDVTLNGDPIAGVSQEARASGHAIGEGAQAASLYSTETWFDLFFDPLQDQSGFFLDGDVLAVDFALDYELMVSAFNGVPAEPVDALATLSLFSFWGVQTLDELLGVGGSEAFGVDFFLSEQVFGGDPSVSLAGTLNFSLLLDSWFLPFDGLTLQVEVDGGGTSQVPTPGTAWLLALGLLALGVTRTRSSAFTTALPTAAG